MKKLLAGLALLQDAAWLGLRRVPALGIWCAGLLAAWVVFCGLLNVPDAHVWVVAISGLGWLMLAAGLLWLHVVVLRRIRGVSPRVALVWAIPTLLVWVVIWAAAWIYLAQVADRFTEYASYLNSRLPVQGRQMLTFDRLEGLMEDAYVVVQWWLLPGLLLPCVMETATSGLRAGTWRRIAGVWRGWVWWVVLIVFHWVARVGTRHLLVWHPMRSAEAELMSALGRSLMSGVMDVVLGYFVLALAAIYLTRDAAGTPAVSQPRTVEKP